MCHRIARFGSPTVLGVALLLFLLPFLAVSCDVPSGYGRLTPGGTTTYSGLSLAMKRSADVVSTSRIEISADRPTEPMAIAVGSKEARRARGVHLLGDLFASRFSTVRRRGIPTVKS